jgi:hypothetical protein
MADHGKPATADEADRAVRLRVVQWMVAQEEDINEAYTARLRRLEATAKRRGLAAVLLEAITLHARN